MTRDLASHCGVCNFSSSSEAGSTLKVVAAKETDDYGLQCSKAESADASENDGPFDCDCDCDKKGA